MSALGIYDTNFDAISAFPMPGARVGCAVASLAIGIAIVGLVDGLGAAPDTSSETRPAALATPSGGSFAAIGFAGRPRPADPIADFMRHGLVPDARSPKGWVPDAMGSLDICRLPRGGVRWSIAKTNDPLMRRAAGSRHAQARRHQHRHAKATSATLDGTLRFRLSSGFGVADGFTAPANTISAFEALPPLDTTELDVVSVEAVGAHGIGNPATDAEHRRAAAIGTGANALQFDDRPGQLSAAAQAGLWNGTPATAMGVGYTLPNRIRLDAAGITNVNTWTNVGKTFQVSTVASIPLN